MAGQSTHSKRRYSIGAFHSRYFVDNGIDVGAGHDPLINNAHAFRLIRSIASWDVEQGDAQYLAGVPDNHFDFLHSSHTLEHMRDPKIGLENWVRVVKPGGYLVITIPDEDLYEKGFWPSRYNSDHKWSFTIFKTQSWNQPNSVNVLDLCRHVGGAAETEKLEIIRDFFNEQAPREIDQTARTLTAECAIELILRKR